MKDSKEKRSFSARVRERQGGGFSLIELLAVTAIISILIGMVATAAHSARRRAYVSQARIETQQVATAFKSYWIVKGKWPSNYDSASGFAWRDISKNEILSSDIMGERSGGVVRSAAFLELSEDSFEDDFFRDPWGNPYQLKITAPEDVEQPEVFQVIVGFVNSESYYYRD